MEVASDTANIGGLLPKIDLPKLVEDLREMETHYQGIWGEDHWNPLSYQLKEGSLAISQRPNFECDPHNYLHVVENGEYQINWEMLRGIQIKGVIEDHMESRGWPKPKDEDEEDE